MKMELKNKMEEVKAYISNALKKIGAVSVILMAIGAGFVVGYYYNTLFKKMEDNNQFKHIRTMSETSIAINEKNQILIMDRNNGVYKIYEDSVGMVIFNMYASKLFVKQHDGITK
jgi:hypothetical protein